MDLFNSYGTEILLKAVENIEDKIFNSSAYIYYDNDNSYLIQEYKKFEVTIISTALIAIFFEIDISIKDNREKLKKIYLGKTTDFQRLLLSKELIVRHLDVSSRDKSIQENMLSLKIGAKFEEYFSEIIESLNDKSIYSFLEYETPQRKWDSVYMTFTDEVIKGENRMYSYLWNLFLCYENIDFEIFEYEQKCIDLKIFLNLEKRDLTIIENFLTEIMQFRN